MMSGQIRETVLVGALATLAFSLGLHVVVPWGIPAVNMALWDGSFFSINLGWAIFWGLWWEWLFGSVLVAVYRELWMPRMRGPGWRQGLTFGLAWWAFMMVVGFPLLGLLSPLARDGLAPAPGFLALGEGTATPLAFLIAMLAFGGVAGALTTAGRFRPTRFRWR